MHYPHRSPPRSRRAKHSRGSRRTKGNYLDEVWTLDDRTGGITVADLNDGTGSERHFYHQNTLYHVYALTGETGAIAEAVQSYDAYGNVTALITGAGTDTTWFTADDVLAGNPNVSAIGNPYFYTGQRLDPETGLMYYKNRYYSTELGRFITRDPIGYSAGSMGLFEYVGSQPVSFADPNGLVGEVCSYTGHYRMRITTLRHQFDPGSLASGNVYELIANKLANNPIVWIEDIYRCECEWQCLDYDFHCFWKKGIAFSLPHGPTCTGVGTMDCEWRRDPSGDYYGWDEKGSVHRDPHSYEDYKKKVVTDVLASQELGERIGKEIGKKEGGGDMWVSAVFSHIGKSMGQVAGQKVVTSIVGWTNQHLNIFNTADALCKTRCAKLKGVEP